jgi:cytochrome bd-type quinol oxidase subunit 2
MFTKISAIYYHVQKAQYWTTDKFGPYPDSLFLYFNIIISYFLCLLCDRLRSCNLNKLMWAFLISFMCVTCCTYLILLNLFPLMISREECSLLNEPELSTTVLHDVNY